MVALDLTKSHLLRRGPTPWHIAITHSTVEKSKSSAEKAGKRERSGRVSAGISSAQVRVMCYALADAAAVRVE